MKNKLEKLKVIFRDKLTLYPIFTGILFLVNELRNNAIFYTLQESVSLILIILAFVFVADLLSRKLIKDKTKAALIATLFIIINLFYQDIFLAITRQRLLVSFDNLTNVKHSEVVIIPIVLVTWLIFTFFILRTKRILAGINLYLNILIIIFVLVEIVQWAIIPVPQIQLADNKPFPVNVKLLPEQKPDIYYIILDSYTSSESLKKYWKYDNSVFEDSLKHLGFQIDSKSKSDYASTPYCLASYLNSSTLLMDTTKYHYNERNLLQLIRKNHLYNWLNANNYHCNNLSIFDAFGSNKYYNFFTYNHILGRTIWFVNYVKLHNYFNNKKFGYISETNLKLFNDINKQVEEKHDQPTFTYAHVMMPHTPYTFNEYGKPYKATDTMTNKQKYLGQLIYTSSLALKTINHILKSSRRMPIIVIQGDHGFRFLVDTTMIEKSREAHTIFYAIYSPYGSIRTDNINPSITFRKVIEKINN